MYNIIVLYLMRGKLRKIITTYKYIILFKTSLKKYIKSFYFRT